LYSVLVFKVYNSLQYRGVHIYIYIVVVVFIVLHTHCVSELWFGCSKDQC